MGSLQEIGREGRRDRLLRCSLWTVALLAAASIASQMLAAQPSKPAQAPAPDVPTNAGLASGSVPSRKIIPATASKAAHPPLRGKAAREKAAKEKAAQQAADKAAADAAAALAAKPPQPELPHWPVNDQAGKATVTWDSHGLRIDAANSSLQQILNDVAAVTGATVEGFGADQRVFGAYGPGQARVVLSQLLEGSGYNVLMVGDLGQGAPRQLLLTTRVAAGAAPANPNAANNNQAEDTENEEEPAPQPVPTRAGFPPGMAGRAPQQMQQERQQMMERAREQQQENGNNPPN
jgi:hypothetical protein